MSADMSVNTTKTGDEKNPLKNEEVFFLRHINGSLADLSGLSSYRRSIYDFDHKLVMDMLFRDGYLDYAPIEYVLNKCNVSELKELLVTHKLPTNGKKAELVSRVLDNITTEQCKAKFNREYLVVTPKGLELIDNVERSVEERKKADIYEKLQAHSIIQQESIMKSPSVDRKEWVYTGDYRNDSEHCRNHASMNEQIVPKDKPFKLIGLDGKTYYPMYPRDPILPLEERIGCVCICRGIVRDDVLGLSIEERRRLQAEAIAADNGE